MFVISIVTDQYTDPVVTIVTKQCQLCRPVRTHVQVSPACIYYNYMCTISSNIMQQHSRNRYCTFVVDTRESNHNSSKYGSLAENRNSHNERVNKALAQIILLSTQERDTMGGPLMRVNNIKQTILATPETWTTSRNFPRV